MDNNTENIELRSAEFQEIVGQSPNWLIRSGIFLVLCIILLLLVGSYFFKYPSLIRSDVFVVTQNQQVLISSPVSGMIDSILVADQRIVFENQPLIQFDNHQLICSPIQGKFIYNQFLSPDQVVAKGQVLAKVIPFEEPYTLGIVFLAQDDAFQMATGQTVNIRFNHWPGLEIQPFVGTVQSITAMSTADNYKVEVQLPTGLIAEYKKLFSSCPEIKGSAEIIIEKRRLIEKLINPFEHLLNNNSQGSN